MQIPGAHRPDSLAYWQALSQWGLSQKARWEPSVVACAFNLSTQEAKAGRSGTLRPSSPKIVWQLGLHKETLSLKTRKKKIEKKIRLLYCA